jgi:hypothetical protein
LTMNPFKLPLCVLTAFVFLWVIGVSQGASHKPFRQVIISSDDAGMCAAVNAGTILALKAGLVKSVSIMACCPAFDDFARFAAVHPEYDYGVHLTLTCDMPEQPWGPILSKSKVPSLVTSEGFFPRWPQDVARSADIREVEAELRAQIQKTCKAGIRISHLDHHMFVLFARPDLLNVYAGLAREFDLPVRIESNAPIPLLEPYGREVINAYGRQLKQLEKWGMPVLDHMEYDNYLEKAAHKRNFHMKTLLGLKTGTTEIVIHCSRKSAFGINPPEVDGRVADRRFFSSTEAREKLEKRHVKVIDWREFRQNHHKPMR